MDGASALILARPGPLRDGLQALLTAMPQIEVVNGVSDVSSALKMLFEPGPALVLLDSDLAGGEIWLTVRRAKARWPQAQCVLLTDDLQQQREAEAAGADAVLPKGFPAARLIATMAALLSQQGGQGKAGDDIVVSVPQRQVRCRGKRDRVIL